MKANRCSIASCEKPVSAVQMCSMHYYRMRKYGDPGTVHERERGLCVIDGCNRTHKAHGWCQMHYKRWQKHGDPKVTVRSPQSDTCQADECDRTPLAHSLCQMHLVRMKKRGSLDLPPEPTTDDRFWAKVNKFGQTAPESWDGATLPGRCWEWTGAADRLGYGKFKLAAPDSLIGPHRYSYESLVGSIRDGLHIDHLCRNPRCVNPDHLEPVTPDENTRRGIVARARIAS